MPPKQPKQPKQPNVDTPPNVGICSRILRPTQKYKYICWFLAIIVIIFYSQRSRRVIMEASKTWDGRKNVIKLFRNLLYERYLIVGDEPKNSEEYKTFNEGTFIEILKELYEMDSIKFPYNPRYNEPYYADSYLCKLYTLLGVDYKMFDYTSSKSLYYSSFNKEFDDIIKSYKIPDNDKIYTLLDIGNYKDDGRSPSILIISISSVFTPLFANNEIKDDTVKKELTSMKEEITYNGVKYTLDSVYLTNANETSCNHIIVGMTCKSKKYIFNGQPYMGNRNFPCHLMRHDWNIRKNIDFFLSFDECILYPIPIENPSEKRYNFSEGIRKCIYVRKNASRDTSVSKESDVEKYRQEQIDAAISDKRRDAARLEEEIKKARLRYEEQMKEEEQEKKKKKNIWDEKEVEHYKEQMALIKKEDERKRVSDERKLHKSTHQQRKSDIADLIKIMSKLKLDDDEKENLIPKRNKKRNRKNRSGSDGNSGSKDSPKVIKHPKK
jgi:hypothetical protein